MIGAILPAIVTSAVSAAVTRALKSGADTAQPGRIAATVTAELAKDPVFVNEVSAEAPYQSRVAVGSVVSALGVIVPMLGNVFGFDGGYVVEVIGAAVTLGGALYALYGRFASGLKPLFSRK
jgi:hypothetical protein